MAPGQLFEREVAALVIRAGRAAGFCVRAEVPAPWAKLGGGGRMPAMDYGWYETSTDALVVAWELDGHDVGDAHIAGDPGKNKPGNARKFAGCTAPMKIQVLYSVENALTPKPPSRARFVRMLLPPTIRIITDVELMAPPPSGIDAIMAEAQRAAAATS